MRLLTLLALASSAHASPTLQLDGPRVVTPAEQVQLTVRAPAPPASGRTAEVHLLVGGPPDPACVESRQGICVDDPQVWATISTHTRVARMEIEVPHDQVDSLWIQALGISATGPRWSRPIAVQVAPGVCPTVGGDLPCEPSFIDTDEDGVGDAWTDCGCPMNTGWSEDGGDCDDDHRDVYPGQQTCTERADPIHGFDTDCDGVETVCDMPYTFDDIVCTVPEPGWQMAEPTCGTEAFWVTGARRWQGLCMVEGEMRTVACR